MLASCGGPYNLGEDVGVISDRGEAVGRIFSAELDPVDHNQLDKAIAVAFQEAKGALLTGKGLLARLSIQKDISKVEAEFEEAVLKNIDRPKSLFTDAQRYVIGGRIATVFLVCFLAAVAGQSCAPALARVKDILNSGYLPVDLAQGDDQEMRVLFH